MAKHSGLVIDSQEEIELTNGIKNVLLVCSNPKPKLTLKPIPEASSQGSQSREPLPEASSQGSQSRDSGDK